MDWLSVVLIAGIILLYSFQTLFCTLYNHRYPGKAECAASVFCVLESVFICLLTWGMNGFRFHASPPTLLFGCLNALVLLGYNSSLMAAGKRGSYAALVLLGYNSSLMAAGKRGSYAFFNMSLQYGAILIPMAYSAIFLREGTTPLQWVGVALMLVAFLLMNWERNVEKTAKKGFYVFCALLFLFNGLYSVFLKMQSVACADESAEMVILTFGIMGLVALIRLVMAEKENTLLAFRQDKRSLPPLIACLLSAGLAINGLVAVLPRVNSVVLYTLENGGVLLLSFLYAVLLFHEKPIPQKVVGVGIALISMTLLSL